MTRENFRQGKHKVPKFKDSYDEDFEWEDKLEIQNQRRKSGKKNQKRKNDRDKW